MEIKSKDKFIGKLILNQYKITKKLGEGSFGEVYIIKGLESSQTYACKLVN